MFNCKSWAAAFVNSVDKRGGDTEEALNTLSALAAHSASIKGDALSSSKETAVRFFLLMIKKKRIRHVDSVISEIKNILNKKRGIVTAWAEYAFQPNKEFESLLCEAIKKRTKASSVQLTGLVNPELIGGYRLRIGDEIIDASIRGQMRKIETCLATADGGS
jgi:F-type H+-transporting ATPase subunit delta